MAARWFSVPVVIDPAWSIAGAAPKYADTSGLSGWAGQRVTIDGSEYYAVRYYGTTTALDEIEANDDATSLQESSYTESDVAAWLNDKTGHNYTFSEWEERFLTGDTSA